MVHRKTTHYDHTEWKHKHSTEFDDYKQWLTEFDGNGKKQRLTEFDGNAKKQRPTEFDGNGNKQKPTCAVMLWFSSVLPFPPVTLFGTCHAQTDIESEEEPRHLINIAQVELYAGCAQREGHSFHTNNYQAGSTKK